MKDKNLTVCKSNAVIEAGYRLSLNEQRVVLACIGQVNSTKELFETDGFELSAKDFADLFNVSADRAYGELKEVAKNLYQRSLTIYNPDPDRPKIAKLETRWISAISYSPEEGKIILNFAIKILPYLSNLKGNFTKYELKHIANMSSVYGIRLYELLMQWRSTGRREIEIDWLKKQLQIENVYPAMCDFKKRVIEPAVKDINTHSNFTVAWEQRKTGRSVTHLIFTFAEKQAETTQEATAKPKVKGKMINGVIESELKAKAQRGESTQAATERIKREKEAEVKRLQGNEKKTEKRLEIWEKEGFKSEKEYAVFMFNQQINNINKDKR